jgi:hypothetical protein
MNTRAAGRVLGPSMLVVLAGCAALAGCDRRTQTQIDVEKAAQELTAVTGGRSSAAPTPLREKTYGKVVSDAAPAQGASDADKSAANMLISTALDGQGDLIAARIAPLEGKVRYEIVVVQALLGQWSAASATAAAADALDVSRELADISASGADKDKGIEAESRHRTQIEQQLTDLRARAKTKLDAAEVKLAEYRALTDQALKVTAAEGTPLVERAARVRMEGETLRLEGSRLEAEADSIQPRLAEVTAIIAKLTRQKEDMGRIAESVRARAAAAREESAAARSAAAEAAGRLTQKLTEIETLRTGELAREYDTAVGAYQKAANTARAAATGAKHAGSARLSEGVSLLGVAETQWSRAQGAQTYGALLRTLAGTRPSLPNQSEIAARLTAAADEHKNAIAAAQTALTAAKTAFSGAGVGGTAKERLDALGVILDKALETIQDEKLDAAGKFGFKTRVAAPAPGSTPDAAPAPGNDESLVRAEIEKLFAAQIESRRKIEAIDAACREKFGKSFAEVLASNPAMGMMASTIQQGLSITPSDFKIEMVDDETATATAEGLPVPVTFRKAGGKWEPAMPAGAQGMQDRMMATAMAVFESWGNDVKAGKFADPAAASADLMAKVQAVMMQMMGGDGK